MNNISSFAKAVIFQLLFFGSLLFVNAQQNADDKSTQDLSFLVGEWDIIRINNPGTETERKTTGKLVCQQDSDGQFIKCRYEMERPGKIRALNLVYFNYNQIYGLYENLWLSSTWPIKVLLQGTLQKTNEHYTLITQAQFKIENDITEYVKDDLVAEIKEQGFNSFIRKTYIRTSEYEAGVWHYHMIETAKRAE